MIRFILKRTEKINGERLPDEFITIDAECPKLEKALTDSEYDCDYMHSFKLHTLSAVEVLENAKTD